ncbi:MAG: hypothetical protein EZS28_003845 [Streblomastix strix]|uniref:Protein kinase domain-containing protein n=1 Tax=Streblomastix strix TaxID=222440 RepID=A0A5J4X0B7_9EUKA|nr:MAG: hypothetical protein EZS28_003845 [Streblomastix strix]
MIQDQSQKGLGRKAKMVLESIESGIEVSGGLSSGDESQMQQQIQQNITFTSLQQQPQQQQQQQSDSFIGENEDEVYKQKQSFENFQKQMKEFNQRQIQKQQELDDQEKTKRKKERQEKKELKLKLKEKGNDNNNEDEVDEDQHGIFSPNFSPTQQSKLFDINQVNGIPISQFEDNNFNFQLLLEENSQIKRIILSENIIKQKLMKKLTRLEKENQSLTTQMTKTEEQRMEDHRRYESQLSKEIEKKKQLEDKIKETDRQKLVQQEEIEEKLIECDEIKKEKKKDLARITELEKLLEKNGIRGQHIISNVNNQTLVSFDPIITTGIAHCQFRFKEVGISARGVGVIGADVKIPPSFYPEDCQNLVVYWGDNGIVCQNKIDNKGNEKWGSNKIVEMEVNMKAQPRTLRFFLEGVEQPVMVKNIPEALKFFAYFFKKDSAFELIVLERINEPLPKGKGAAKTVPIRTLGKGSYGEKEITSAFVLKYLAYSDWTYYPYLEMEYCNMQTLNIIVKQPQISLPSYTLRALMKQILVGIWLFHASGLIHRDIKCDNILLHSPPGSGKVYAKISDFGFAKKVDQKDQENSIAGTTPFMAPENFHENPIITQKIDIYALGITFYKLITHKYPVNERNFNEQGKKLTQIKCIKRPSEIKDNHLWDLLSKLLEFDPDKRITALVALQHPYFKSPEAKKDISYILCKTRIRLRSIICC